MLQASSALAGALGVGNSGDGETHAGLVPPSKRSAKLRKLNLSKSVSRDITRLPTEISAPDDDKMRSFPTVRLPEKGGGPWQSAGPGLVLLNKKSRTTRSSSTSARSHDASDPVRNAVRVPNLKGTSGVSASKNSEPKALHPTWDVVPFTRSKAKKLRESASSTSSEPSEPASPSHELHSSTTNSNVVHVAGVSAVSDPFKGLGEWRAEPVALVPSDTLPAMSSAPQLPLEDVVDNGLHSAATHPGHSATSVHEASEADYATPGVVDRDHGTTELGSTGATTSQTSDTAWLESFLASFEPPLVDYSALYQQFDYDPFCMDPSGATVTPADVFATMSTFADHTMLGALPADSFYSIPNQETFNAGNQIAADDNVAHGTPLAVASGMPSKNAVPSAQIVAYHTVLDDMLTPHEDYGVPPFSASKPLVKSQGDNDNWSSTGLGFDLYSPDDQMQQYAVCGKVNSYHSHYPALGCGLLNAQLALQLDNGVDMCELIRLKSTASSSDIQTDEQTTLPIELFIVLPDQVDGTLPHYPFYEAKDSNDSETQDLQPLHLSHVANGDAIKVDFVVGRETDCVGKQDVFFMAFRVTRTAAAQGVQNNDLYENVIL